MEWKELLTRHDLVGGDIEIYLREDGTFRARILGIEHLEGTVHFKTSPTVKAQQSHGNHIWTPCGNRIFRFPTTHKLMGSMTGRVQFDIPNGFVIIFPKGDVSVRR